MAWTTTLTETQNDGRQTLTFSISGHNTDDAANTKKVSFETLRGGGYYRTFTSVTYNEFDDITELLTQNLTDSASAANMTPEDEYDVVLDFSALTDDRLWIDLRFLSSHQRPDQSRELRDGVDANTVGSTITHIIGTDNDDHIIGSYQAASPSAIWIWIWPPLMMTRGCTKTASSISKISPLPLIMLEMMTIPS